MNNDLIIKKSQSNLEKIEVNIVKTINALSSQGYLVNTSKVLKLSVIQMVKHCYKDITLLTDNEVNNLSNVVINI
jgi:hypothetical protein